MHQPRGSSYRKNMGNSCSVSNNLVIPFIFYSCLKKIFSEEFRLEVWRNVTHGQNRNRVSQLFNSFIAHKPFHLPHSSPDAFPQLLTYSVCHTQIFPGLEKLLQLHGDLTRQEVVLVQQATAKQNKTLFKLKI